MAWIRDELIREGCTFLSATSGRLTGALANYRRFRDAKRRNGTPIETGDAAIVNVIQSPAGRAVCKATFTFGAEDTFVLDGSSTYLKQSTAGAGLPGFSSSGAPGEIALVAFAEEAVFDGDLNLQNPDLFRKSILKPLLSGGSGFFGETGTVDEEAVFGLGLATVADGLGGPFYFKTGSALTPDGEDVVAGTGGQYLRLPHKIARTYRGDVLASGNLFTFPVTGGFSAPGRRWLVAAWNTTGAYRSSAYVLGHASDPQVDPINESPLLPFELSGTALGVRNNSGGELTMAHIRPVIG